MLASCSHPQHHTTACWDQQNQTARAFSLRGVNSIMNFVHPVIIPPQLSQITVASRSHYLYAFYMQSALEWSLGPGPTENDHLIIAGMKSCFWPLSAASLGSPLWAQKSLLYISFLYFLFSGLLAFPYLPALGNLLSPTSNSLFFMMWDLLAAPIKWFYFEDSVWSPPRACRSLLDRVWGVRTDTEPRAGGMTW